MLLFLPFVPFYDMLNLYRVTSAYGVLSRFFKSSHRGRESLVLYFYYLLLSLYVNLPHGDLFCLQSVIVAFPGHTCTQVLSFECLKIFE